MIKGRSLELFFVDGRPDGMLTAEVFNWTGHVLRIPRTQIAEGLAREEAAQSGVYILLGEKDGLPSAYIGEAEKFNIRMKEHVAKKDWWDIAVLVTTTGDLLHKAHIKYLEARLFQIASQVGSVSLENSNKPSPSSLNEAATASMEAFLETLYMVLPAIRVDIFLQKAKRPATAGAPAAGEKPVPKFVLESPKSGVSATAELIDGEMVVKAGSRGRLKWVGKEKYVHTYQELHKKLLSTGVIKVEGKNAVFTSDYAFNSPSAASAVLQGRASNGRKEWRVEGGCKTYADWENEYLSISETELK